MDMNLQLVILMPPTLQELPKGKWFCCMDCSRINSVLQNLLVQEAEKLPEFHLNAIKKYAGNSLETVSDIDVRWRLLSGKAATPETRLLLSQAVAIFHVSTCCTLPRHLKFVAIDGCNFYKGDNANCFTHLQSGCLYS